MRIHRLALGASNAYLLENQAGLYLVDAGLPLTDGLILERMEELGRDDLRLIFITHAHIDHYGAAAAVREATGAPIAIHRADAAAMAEGNTELGMVRDWEWSEDTLVPLLEDTIQIDPVEPDFLLDDGASLAEYGLDAVVLHTPGHTPGCISVYLDQRGILFVGDAIINNGQKLVLPLLHCSDTAEARQSVARCRRSTYLGLQRSRRRADLRRDPAHSRNPLRRRTAAIGPLTACKPAQLTIIRRYSFPDFPSA